MSQLKSQTLQVLQISLPHALFHEIGESWVQLGLYLVMVEVSCTESYFLLAVKYVVDS